MEKYTLSLATKTLTITKAFEQKANIFGSEEYNLYMNLTAQIPNLTVVRKSHKSPTKYNNKDGRTTNCNQFKNLTFKRMEAFIVKLPNGEEIMKQFLFLRDYAGELQTSKYTLVRKWFAAQFPNFRTQPLSYLTLTDIPLVESKSFAETAKENASKAS